MTRPRYPAEGDGEAIRIACCIPFCGRSFRNDRKNTPWPKGSRVVCGKHWRMARPLLRKRYAKVKRLLTRGLVSKQHGKRPYRCNIEWVLHRAFERIVKQATEAAGGIG